MPLLKLEIQEVFMRKRLQSRVIFLIVSIFLLICACGRSVQELKIDNTDAKCQLVIAVIRTRDFKDSVINGIVEKYRDTCAIEVMNVSNVEQITQKEFDVVLLVDECRAGMRFNKKLEEIVDELDKKKVVLFVTAGDPDWEYTYKDIDAVTSASEEDKTQEVIQEIAKKIDEVLD
jgi:hypothetical protein